MGNGDALQARVTIVIVTFNSARVIGECLAAVPPGVKLCLVDNDSRDNTLELVRQLRPDAQIIINPDNLGFGAAVNMGARQVDTEFVLLLNPDARMDPGTVETLVAKADAYPDAAIISPVLFHPDGEQQTSYRLNVFDRDRYPKNYIEPSGDLCVEFFSGAVMLWRMADIREIGFFDENFFFTYEDDDLCMRTRLAGKSLIVTPDASVTHAPGTSTPPTAEIVLKKTRYVMTSRLYMEQKYRGMSAARKMAVREAVKYFFRTLVYLPLFYKKGILRSYGRYRAAMSFLLSTFRA